MKTQTAAHTPTPWILVKEINAIYGPNLSDFPDGQDIRDLVCEPRTKANAAFIVRAVNAHEELLQSLKDVLSCYKRVWTDAGKDQNGSLYIGIAEKTIAKAEGKL